MKAGTRLGPYEIVEPLGAGGMGEVYLADDTRLGRRVAIKVLPADFAAVPERLARFEQEARAAAALNHPNIAAVYDVGFAEGVVPDSAGQVEGQPVPKGTHYFVQEYLEGHSLRTLLQEQKTQLDSALGLGVEIAEALAAAHRKGIVHRDLKPENLFVTPEGHAKILDFGLAKLTEMSAISSPGGATMSPTMMGTVAGQIMGTAGYMAPEQIEGAEVDGRADLFAFGCVLYEMVCGRRPFEGRSVHETLSNIVHDTPKELREIDATLPIELQRILSKCLAKDRTRRYQHADDLAVDLAALRGDVRTGEAATGTRGGDVATSAVASRGVPVPMAIVGSLLLAAIASAGAWWLTPAEESPVRRLSIAVADAPPAATNQGRVLDISPDGSQVVYVGQRDGDRRLFLRRLDSFDIQELEGTGNAHEPSFSPDGRWVVFGDGAVLKKVPVDGGRPLELGSITPPAWFDWGDDGYIYFTQGRQLLRVVAAGGTPEVVVDPPEATAEVRYPMVLPGSRRVVVTEAVSGAPVLVSYELATGDRTEVISGGYASIYAPSGHLLYFQLDGSRLVVPFDAGTGAVVGDPRPLQEAVTTGDGAMLAVSSTGALAYLPGSNVDFGTAELVWVDRNGDATPILDERRPFDVPRLSPDGRRIAEALGTDTRDLWLIELEPEPIMRRWTFDADDRHPAWSPDGSSLVFRSTGRGGKTGLFLKSADDSVKEAELLLDTPNLANPHGWTADGGLIYHQITADRGRDLMILPAGGGESRAFLGTPFDEQSAAISPDGRWVAYRSNQSGTPEVYVRPYPGPDPEYLISNQGGESPAWSRDGSELYYIDADERLVAVRVETDERLRVLGRERLFDVSGYLSNNARTPYDVHPDGRFLMVRVSQGENAGAQLHIVESFGAVLREMFAPPG